MSAPHWVKNQQVAEAWGLEYCTRVLIRRRESTCSVVGDNTGTLWNLCSLKPRISSTRLRQIYRRIFHLLHFSGKRIQVYWVPTTLQPADHPSRCPSKFPDIHQALYNAQQTYKLLLTSPCLQHMGTVSVIQPIFKPTSGVGVL